MTLKLNHRSLLTVILVSLCLVIPLAFLTSRLSFRLNTDYDVVLPMAQYAINAFTKPSMFLNWNPYIGLGVPVLGDPSSLLFSPFYVPFFIVFGADAGLRLIIACTILLSGITMWVFLSSQKLNYWVVAWGAILYELSGAVAAMISSGHIEKFVTYALTPVVFLFLFRKKTTIKEAAVLGIIFACFYLSDDFYGPWFFSILYVISIVFRLWTKSDSMKRVLGGFAVTYGFFLAYTSPKLVFFVRDVLPHFQRLATVNPYEGSIHAWFLPLVYIIPWQVSFYDRPTLERLLNFHFNWYEYYAFISPFALVPLIYIKKVLTRFQIKLSLLFIIVGALYISLAYPYSPFHWIFHFFPIVRMFRVPQRIAVPLLVPLLLTVGYCADRMLINKHKTIRNVMVISMVASALWVFLITFQTVRNSFEPPRRNENAIAKELRHLDPSHFYVVNFVCCMQTYLLQQSIPILNYYYGWTPSYAPTFKNKTGDAYDFSQLSYIRPSYIIASVDMSFTSYNYRLYFKHNNIEVWKTETPTIFPSL